MYLMWINHARRLFENPLTHLLRGAKLLPNMLVNLVRRPRRKTPPAFGKVGHLRLE